MKLPGFLHAAPALLHFTSWNDSHLHAGRKEIPASPSSRLTGHKAPPVCDCTGAEYGYGGTNASISSGYICGDYRLGPNILPTKIPLSSFLVDYDRFGGKTPGQFLHDWWDTGAQNWIFPGLNGFSVDSEGNAINGTMVLEPGTLVDRFGRETGSFISAADAPYSQRSLPPWSLDTDQNAPEYPYGYHVYMVVKRFKVVGGPIAPWFGQPGLGAQFYTGAVGTVLTLISEGYLARVQDTALISVSQGCGVRDHAASHRG